MDDEAAFGIRVKPKKDQPSKRIAPSRAKTLGIARVADAMGVHVQTVRTWIKRGCPHTRRKGRIFLNIEAVQAWKDVELPEKARPDLEQAKLRKELALAQLRELQLAKEEGKLVRLAHVQKQWSANVQNAKARFLAMPGVIAAQLEGRQAADIQRILDDRISEIIRELAGSGDLDPDP